MTGSSQPLILQLKGVTKDYPTGDGIFRALNDVHLDVHKGEFLGITGKSGAGKTTLLNMITGISEVSVGEICFDPADPNRALPIHALDENSLASWRGENVGIVYQSFELIPSLSLVENVMLPPDFGGNYHPVITKERALELLNLVEIGEHAYKIPAHISGGQKQRVAIARALVNDPDLIAADEPTGNLDTVTAETIIRIFENLVAEGKTVVMVTHDQSMSSRFSRHVRVRDGELRTIDEQDEAPLAIQHLARGQVVLKARTNGKKATTAVEADYPAIQLTSVNKTYENAAGKFVALKSIDLTFDYGNFISIVGKSGSGKSTLLNMITGIDHPSSGEVVVGNNRIYELSESKRARWRGLNMGVVFQFFQLLPTLTLLENTMLPMDYCGVYSFNERPKKARELLKLVGLEEHANKLPSMVSSGQQQSAAIARSLATDPPIILADEPTGNLDTRSAEVVLDLFDKLAAQGKTILIVTHEPTITQRTDQVVILSDGEIIHPAVAECLPYLSHPDMLKVSKMAQTRQVAAGEPLLKSGDSVDQLILLAAGQLDVLDGRGRRSGQLQAGQIFGGPEILNGGSAQTGLSGSELTEAQVLVLERSEIIEIIQNSAATAAELANGAILSA
jgi:putative ABC transport system ATP-binding protein